MTKRPVLWCVTMVHALRSALVTEVRAASTRGGSMAMCAVPVGIQLKRLRRSGSRDAQSLYFHRPCSKRSKCAKCKRKLKREKYNVILFLSPNINHPNARLASSRYSCTLYYCVNSQVRCITAVAVTIILIIY